LARQWNIIIGMSRIFTSLHSIASFLSPTPNLKMKDLLHSTVFVDSSINIASSSIPNTGFTRIEIGQMLLKAAP